MIVHEAVYGELQSKLVAAAERLRLGPGWEDATDVGPLINRAALDKVTSYTEIGRDEGAKLLTGGEAVDGRRASTTARPSSPTSSRGCGSRRRRSSARRRR